MARVALVCNLIHPGMLGTGRLDAVAELDNEETLLAVETALRQGGHEVRRVEADADLANRLRNAPVDIVFNISEGVSLAHGVGGGASRESLVPAVCELLVLPYTGSGVLSTALCLDKPRTKQLLAWHAIPTPAFQVFEQPDAPLDAALRFPLIAKLAREGSSMGLGADSIVDSETALRPLLARLLQTWRQPVLVEQFIEGREFTVGVLGNQHLQVLPVVELVFEQTRGINLFDPDDPVLLMAQASGAALPPAGGAHRSLCPAPISDALAGRIGELARRAFHALDCRDWCRIDFRMDRAGALYLLELNPIAGIDPAYLLPRAAAAAGLSYAALVNRILDEALARTCSR